jgi:hypothetical protein
MFGDDPNPEGLRVIKTARDEASINEAARQGLFPLVRPVQPSPEIRSKYAIAQNKTTGEIQVIGDYRSLYREPIDAGEIVIDFTFYYPHSFPSPFAAYLIPRDLQVGERVYLEDLIEDVVGGSWNQGDTYRLASCIAVWNGKDFELEFDPDKDQDVMIG